MSSNSPIQHKKLTKKDSQPIFNKPRLQIEPPAGPSSSSHQKLTALQNKSHITANLSSPGIAIVIPETSFLQYSSVKYAEPEVKKTLSKTNFK